MPRGQIVIIASNMPRALRHNGNVHFVFGYEVFREEGMRFIEFKEAKGDGDNLQLSISNAEPQYMCTQDFRWQASLEGEIDANSLHQFMDSLKEEGEFLAQAPGQPFARGYNGLSLTLFFLKLAGYANLIESPPKGLYEGLFILGSGTTMANYHHFCQVSNADLYEKDLEDSLKAASACYAPKGRQGCCFFCSDPVIRVEFSKGLQYENKCCCVIS